MGNGLQPCKQHHPSFLCEPLINPEEAKNENLRVFSVTELKKATNKFKKDRVVTGEDGTVRTFYKGYIDGTTSQPSRTEISVSVMECLQDSSQDVEEWKLSKEEPESLGQISHPNLVKLLGYCCEDNKSLLVFEYLHKGSLDHYIFGKEEALPWKTRVKIAIGIAQGIAFLHSIKNSPLHQELRMHNIMLDEQYNAKLFYLESKRYSLTGTLYMSPEYLCRGRLGLETDVFAFGVILLVLFTGSKDIAKNLRRCFNIKPFLIGEVIDPRLGSDYPVTAVTKMGALIQRCTMVEWKRRPLMQQVLDDLNSIVEIKY